LITPADQPTNSLCTSPPPEATPVKSTPILINRVMATGTATDIDAGDLASYAMIVPGAVYRRNASLIPESVTVDHRWFNFACTDDALARIELVGLPSPPIVDTGTAERRLPALHMFTAKYCGGVSATIRGTPIAVQLNGATTVTVTHDGTGPIEAKW